MTDEQHIMYWKEQFAPYFLCRYYRRIAFLGNKRKDPHIFAYALWYTNEGIAVNPET